MDRKSELKQQYKLMKANYSEDLKLLEMIWEEKLVNENYSFYKR